MPPTSVERKAFRRFLDERIDHGDESTPEQVLAEWRVADRERRETIEAVREGLDDLHAGRVRTLEEFDREFRQRRGLEGEA